MSNLSPTVMVTNPMWPTQFIIQHQWSPFLTYLWLGLHGRRPPSADRLPVHPSMWTTDRNLGSNRPSYGQIRIRMTKIIILRWTNGPIGWRPSWSPISPWWKLDEFMLKKLQFSTNEMTQILKFMIEMLGFQFITAEYPLQTNKIVFKSSKFNFILMVDLS